MAREEVDGGGLESGAVEKCGSDGAYFQEAELFLRDGREGRGDGGRGGGRSLEREDTHRLQAGDNPLAGIVERDRELGRGLVGGAATEGVQGTL